MIHGLTFKEYIEEEKAKIAEMDGKEKKQYFMDYYLKFIIGAVVILILLIWIIVDICISGRNAVASGGVVNLAISDEGKAFLTDDYLDHLGKSSFSNQSILAADIFLSDSSDTEYADFLTFQAQLATNTFNYLIVDETALQYCMELDYSLFENPNKILDQDLKNAFSGRIAFHPLKKAEGEEQGETGDGSPGVYAIDISDTDFAKKYITADGPVYFLFSGSVEEYDLGVSILKYIMGM